MNTHKLLWRNGQKYTVSSNTPLIRLSVLDTVSAFMFSK